MDVSVTPVYLRRRAATTPMLAKGGDRRGTAGHGGLRRAGQWLAPRAAGMGGSEAASRGRAAAGLSGSAISSQVLRARFQHTDGDVRRASCTP